MKRVSKDRVVDINDTLVQASVKIDDGCDYTQRIIWGMNNKRSMRNGEVAPKPEAPQVASVKIEPKKKPRKRGYRVVQKAIGAV
ncbi:hypothetical protein [Erwinia rhapontici]|uniref:hypothetical protein n=1 Tax=Erwinia rhapontici TaxID=55212 RepID=UPI003D36C2E5